ncbi:MAG: endonuclease/exonuclease/phosphatase family protein [Armatimonadetes bacterium]|nr:endonuclease/exonuclease/phosphatase family protein [Armatimonadota bacterium]
MATFNLHGTQRRWQDRRELIVQQLVELHPDILCLNEISVLGDTGRWLWRRALDFGLRYHYHQDNTPGYYWAADANAILTGFPVVETGHFDYYSGGRHAQVARLHLDGRLVDVYVTHLHHRRAEDSLREYQVQLLLGWVDSRDEPDARVICGDFNAPPEVRSFDLIRQRFQPTQLEPTVPTPLRLLVDPDPDADVWRYVRREPFQMCVDYIWYAPPLRMSTSGRCFDKPSAENPALWPSDHVGVWADFELIG